MPISTQFAWRKTGATVDVELLTVVALGFAVVGYVEWSSDAALNKFMSANRSSVSEPDQSNSQRKTGCPVGKKELPTQLRPLP